jgi:hypothetical protein
MTRRADVSRPSTAGRRAGVRRSLVSSAGAVTACLMLAACGLGGSGSDVAHPGTTSPSTSASVTGGDPTTTPSETASPTDVDGATPDPGTTQGTPDASSEPPTPTSSATKPTTSTGGSSATLVFSGEVLMHQTLIDRALSNASGRQYDFAPMFAEIRDVVGGADYAVCHLELPVIPDGQGMEPRYATPPQVIDALAYAGFNRCDTASNHILDRGAAGIDATLAALKANGITQSGIGASASDQRPKVFSVKGFTVAHLSYTTVDGKPVPPGQPWRLARAERGRIASDIKAARSAGAEYVVVSIHDADELHHTATPNQKRWDYWLTDVAGADLVVGTGSHVPEGLEERNGSYILFGLGNLINWRPNARDSVLGRVTLTRDKSGKVVAQVPELIPTFTDAARGYQVLDVRPSVAQRYASNVRVRLAAAFAREQGFVGKWIPTS